MRRSVIAFGTIFKHIQMINYGKDSDIEFDRITVPLTYAGKEDYLTRLLTNPDLHKETQINLPRMSFEMTNIAYDSSRKLSSFLSSFNKIQNDNTGTYQQYIGTPYNIDFELNLYIRNVEDGTQIIEQILPYFNPDYTLAMTFVDSMNITKDVPIIMESIRYDPNYQGMADATTRILTWTLTFKMKTYFFGPINTAKIIRKSTANTYLYNTSPRDSVDMLLNAGLGGYRLGETVYQGTNIVDATATADVLAWDSISGKMTITNIMGTFAANANVVGSISSASHSANVIYSNKKLLDSIVITPDPSTANIDEDFGFTEVNTEYV